MIFFLGVQKDLNFQKDQKRKDQSKDKRIRRRKKNLRKSKERRTGIHPSTHSCDQRTKKTSWNWGKKRRNEIKERKKRDEIEKKKIRDYIEEKKRLIEIEERSNKIEKKESNEFIIRYYDINAPNENLFDDYVSLSDTDDSCE